MAARTVGDVLHEVLAARQPRRCGLELLRARCMGSRLLEREPDQGAGHEGEYDQQQPSDDLEEGSHEILRTIS